MQTITQPEYAEIPDQMIRTDEAEALEIARRTGASQGLGQPIYDDDTDDEFRQFIDDVGL